MDPILFGSVQDDIQHIPSLNRIPKLCHFGFFAKRLLNHDFPLTPKFKLKTNSGGLLSLSYILQRGTATSTSSSTTTTTTSTSTGTSQTNSLTATIVPKIRFRQQGIDFKGTFDIHNHNRTNLRLSVQNLWINALKLVCKYEHEKRQVETELTYRHGRGNGVVGLSLEGGRTVLTLSSVLRVNDRSLTNVVLPNFNAQPDVSVGAQVKCVLSDAVNPQVTVDSVMFGANYVSRPFDISATVEGTWKGNSHLSIKQSGQLLYRHSSKTAFAADVTVQDEEMKGLTLREATTIQFGAKHKLSDATVMKGRLNSQTGVVGVSVSHQFSKKAKFSVGTEFNMILNGLQNATPLNMFGFSFTYSP